MANCGAKPVVIVLALGILLQTTLENVQAQQQQLPRPRADQRQAPTTGADDEYLVGFGISDITGPSADINLVSLISQLIEFAQELLTTGRPATTTTSRGSHAATFEPGHFTPGAGVSAAASATGADQQTTDKNGTEPLAQTVVGQQQEPPASAPPAASDHSTAKTSDQQQPTWTNATKGHLEQRAAQQRQATISLGDRPLMSFSYPNWRDFQQPKLQIKVNLNNFFTNPPMSPRTLPPMLWPAHAAAANSRRRQSSEPPIEVLVSNLIGTVVRWAMPNQIRMQVEYTYANFVVRL